MISVIIPVYNSAAYLGACLDSILAQDTEYPHEVILIDDCSSDGSLEICRRYLADYPDIFILLECAKNSGVGAARNQGLDRARGDYLMFVDADDLLPPSALQGLAAAAERYDADCVKGNIVLFGDDYERPAPDRIDRTVVIRGDSVLTTLYLHEQVRGHIGGKLFRRETLGPVRFSPGIRMAEDLLFFSELFARARSLVLLHENVYRYRKHPTGASGSKFDTGAHADWLDAVEASGKFAASKAQRRAFKSLLLRTLTQIARELRSIPAQQSADMLRLLEQRRRKWGISLFGLILRDRLGLRSLSRYIKMQLALGRIRRKLG